jgi:hypothetical protein
MLLLRQPLFFVRSFHATLEYIPGLAGVVNRDRDIFLGEVNFMNYGLIAPSKMRKDQGSMDLLLIPSLYHLGGKIHHQTPHYQMF